MFKTIEGAADHFKIAFTRVCSLIESLGVPKGMSKNKAVIIDIEWLQSYFDAYPNKLKQYQTAFAANKRKRCKAA